MADASGAWLWGDGPLDADAPSSHESDPDTPTVDPSPVERGDATARRLARKTAHELNKHPFPRFMASTHPPRGPVEERWKDLDAPQESEAKAKAKHDPPPPTAKWVEVYDVLRGEDRVRAVSKDLEWLTGKTQSTWVPKHTQPHLPDTTPPASSLVAVRSLSRVAEMVRVWIKRDGSLGAWDDQQPKSLALAWRGVQGLSPFELGQVVFDQLACEAEGLVMRIAERRALHLRFDAVRLGVDAQRVAVSSSGPGAYEAHDPMRWTRVLVEAVLPSLGRLAHTLAQHDASDEGNSGDDEDEDEGKEDASTHPRVRESRGSASDRGARLGRLNLSARLLYWELTHPSSPANGFGTPLQPVVADPKRLQASKQASLERLVRMLCARHAKDKDAPQEWSMPDDPDPKWAFHAWRCLSVVWLSGEVDALDAEVALTKHPAAGEARKETPGDTPKWSMTSRSIIHGVAMAIDLVGEARPARITRKQHTRRFEAALDHLVYEVQRDGLPARLDQDIECVLGKDDQEEKISVPPNASTASPVWARQVGGWVAVVRSAQRAHVVNQDPDPRRAPSLPRDHAPKRRARPARRTPHARKGRDESPPSPSPSSSSSSAGASPSPSVQIPKRYALPRDEAEDTEVHRRVRECVDQMGRVPWAMAASEMLLCITRCTDLSVHHMVHRWGTARALWSGIPASGTQRLDPGRFDLATAPTRLQTTTVLLRERMWRFRAGMLLLRVADAHLATASSGPQRIVYLSTTAMVLERSLMCLVPLLAHALVMRVLHASSRSGWPDLPRPRPHARHRPTARGPLGQAWSMRLLVAVVRAWQGWVQVRVLQRDNIVRETRYNPQSGSVPHQRPPMTHLVGLTSPHLLTPSMRTWMDPSCLMVGDDDKDDQESSIHPGKVDWRSTLDDALVQARKGGTRKSKHKTRSTPRASDKTGTRHTRRTRRR